MKLSLVVPCYNEADNVKLFYEKVEDTFSEQSFAYEYIFINDGSRDQTLKQRRNPVCRLLNLSMAERLLADSARHVGDAGNAADSHSHMICRYSLAGRTHADRIRAQHFAHGNFGG